MPKLPQTVRRNGVYFLRVRVPSDLVKIMGKKEITKTLKTSDYRQAKERLRAEILHLDAEFGLLRKKNQNDNKRKIPLSSFTSTETTSLVLKWMQDRQEAEENSELTINWDEAHMNLQEEIGVITGALQDKDYNSGMRIAKAVLAKQDISFDTQSKEFRALAKVFVMARLELATRSLQLHTGQPSIGTGDQLFASFHSGGILLSNTDKKKITFGDFCKLYEKDREENVRPRVLRGIKEEIEVLKNFISPDVLLHEIDREKCKEVFECIKQLPKYAAQKYPGENLRRVIELSNKDGSEKLGPKRINHYMVRLNAIFGYAIREQYLNNSPAVGLIKQDKRRKKDLRNPFPLEALQKIFSAPLYTGCLNDEYGYSTMGSNYPRRARFWVPLIALWTGMRLEEICQLDVNDIQKHNGVDVFEIFPSHDKSVKTESGERIIPVHMELKKIGFLKYVQKIKKEGHTKLFPELTISSTGNYSQPVSKWFGRFLDSLGLSDPKLSFHSFRHNFRDALPELEMPLDFTRSLGGWSGECVLENYGKGIQAAKLDKYHKRIKYAGLDLSHLHIQQ